MMLWIYKKSVYTLSFVVSILNNCCANNYCYDDLCDGTKEHTLCKFQISGPSPNCLEYEKTILNERDKHDIVDKINLRRNKVASGEIRSLPAAQGMMKLEWNDDLALSAQRWADQCITNERNVVDSCRDLENMRAGQNVATIYGESPGLTPNTMVDVWYMELLNINTSVVSSYIPSSLTEWRHYDYFTQLIWGVTNQVGCGGVKFKGNTEDKNGAVKQKTINRLVCNFAPMGNIIGEVVYSPGRACSVCPQEYSCDSVYHSLCGKISFTSTKYQLMKDNYENSFEFMGKYKSFSQTTDVINDSRNIDLDTVQPTSKLYDNDNGDSFDLLSHLFETTNIIRATTKSVQKCKDVLAVEDFINLLKTKLNKEHLIREYLFTTKDNIVTSAYDESVADIIQQLYSKKASSTTSISTVNENLNSTLLADLVEAVIFRQNDRFSTTDKGLSNTQVIVDVKPVRIQPALGEIKPNNEFTGHYFFPEIDEDKFENETTESYYDSISQSLPEMDFEIDNINKNARTRNFLDDILEEELMFEGTLDDTSNPTTIRSDVHNESQKINFFLKNLQRVKRRHECKNDKYKEKKIKIFINYYDLLKKLAFDLKYLKLGERFSCAFNSAFYSIPFVNTLLLFYVLITHCNLFNIVY